MPYPKLARYEVLGRLATGGMAEVWLARAVGPGGFEKTVVLKTILQHLAADPQFTAMFINEARVAAMLSHPNCVQIFDLGEDAGTLYIAMEYIDGFALSRVLKRLKSLGRRMPVEVLARIMMDAASGLEYAHKLTDREGKPMGLVHRDVSPDNLLISFSGQTRLVDFGIAKAATSGLMAGTSAGVVKGKFGYIAPEYLKGARPDGRADLFALGVVFYRALTGKRPFTGPNEAAVSMAVLSTTPTPPAEVEPTVSPALSAVVMMALEKDPAARFETAKAMRQAVEVAVARPADMDTVGDFMNSLWPAGDPERAALETLAEGVNEEKSGPILSSVVSSGFGQSRSQVVQQATRLIPPRAFEGEPPPAPAPAPAPALLSLPAMPAVPFDEPRPRRWWLGAVLLAIAVGGGVAALKLGPLNPQPVPAPAPQPQPAPVVPPPVAVVEPPKPAPTTGQLTVKTDPAVTVLEGKKELGKSPVTLELEPGSHTLRLVNRQVGVDQTLVLEVKAGVGTTVDAIAKGAVVVKAEPWAYVKLDGRMLGQTPIGPLALFEGSHQVELSNPGLNETRRIDFKVKGGETRNISVNLEE